MMPRFYLFTVLVLGCAGSPVFGQTPSVGRLAAFDEATLRQGGVETDAASLLKLLRDFAHNDGDTSQCPALIEQLGSTQFEQREAAARQLNDIGQAALPALRSAHKQHADPEVRQRAEHCINVMESRLHPNTIMSAVRRLIVLRAAGAVERLLEVLPSVDWEIQDEIFHGLPRVALRDGRLDPALLAALEDKVPMRRAAAALAVAVSGNGEERDRVRKLLGDNDASVRLRAAQSLLAAYDASTLPVLIALLDEPSVDISWSAEELLHWVAGKTAPEAAVGAASASERKKAVAAWSAWHKSFAKKVDWEQLEKEPRRPGLYFACENGAVWLGGCDGKRWTLTKLTVHDVALLPNNRVLLAHGDGLINCDLEGNQRWNHHSPGGHPYLSCQRMPNRHLFAATSQETFELTADGKEVAAGESPDLWIVDAGKLRSGLLMCRHQDGVAELDGATGRVRYEGKLDVRHDLWRPFAVLPDGRCLLCDWDHDVLLEVTASGVVLEKLPLRDAWTVAALRDGHYLVTSDGPTRRILEMDAAGRNLWEICLEARVHRIRPVLDKVRIGFDKVRPADFNLDSVAHRVRCLKVGDRQRRECAAQFLGDLRPTDETSIAALVAGLDDDNAVIRGSVARALSGIGAAAVPALCEVLKHGTERSRDQALTALGGMEIAPKEAVPNLLGLLTDHKLNTDLRHRAGRLLAWCGPHDGEVVPILFAGLSGNDEVLRGTAFIVLPYLGADDPKVIAALLAPLKDPKHPNRVDSLFATKMLGAKGKPALADLIAIAQNTAETPELRVQALDTLDAVAPEARVVMPPLLDILKGGDKHPVGVYRAAADSLRRLGPNAEEAIPALGSLLRDPKLEKGHAECLTQTLAALGKKAVPELARAIREGNRDTRLHAMEALIEISELAGPALPALEEATQDKDEAIRVKAAMMLTFIKARCRNLDMPVS